jgi:hypothetical protein
MLLSEMPESEAVVIRPRVKRAIISGSILPTNKYVFLLQNFKAGFEVQSNSTTEIGY